MDAGGDDERARIARKMFLSEAHLVGMLQHPHILPIYDAGEENGHCYIVTEHVHGARTLAAYCRPDNLLRIDDTVEIMFKCAKALHYAHSRGVIHRDIKPSNIMLTQDSDVRIIDFGIALVSDSDISRIEGIAGSPSYMSPEQVQSLELTNRSDLYSLGAVMYELLTGARPFRAGNLQKLLHQIVYATPPPIHTLRKDVPEEIETVVAMAMQKDPEKRCKTGLDFAAELTRVHQRLREANSRIDRQEQFGVLRRLKFFHEFSHAEIWEVLRASQLAGLRGGRGDRQGRRDGRSLLHPGDRRLRGGASRPAHRRARHRRLLRRGELRAGRQAHRHHPRRGRGDRAEGELDAARAGLGLLPAALQPRVPALAHRAPAERGSAPDPGRLGNAAKFRCRASRAERVVRSAPPRGVAATLAHGSAS